ncbi:MAG: hypothetical protein H8K04_02425 [Nitrospira sp.]
MILREEIRQFMIASENLLDGTMRADELTSLDLELIQYYLFEIAQKYPPIFPG